MNLLTQSRNTTLLLVLIALAFACFALTRQAHAVSPPPDGGYPGNNTAEGQNALFSLTTGTNNTATGKRALYSNTSGNDNTAVGTAALFNNIAPNNTAVGTFALLSNVGDPDPNNFSGVFNNAVGANAMRFNVDGISNNALGESALRKNIHGVLNTAMAISRSRTTM